MFSRCDVHQVHHLCLACEPAQSRHRVQLSLVLVVKSQRSPKLFKFTLRGPWMCVLNFRTVHPIVCRDISLKTKDVHLRVALKVKSGDQTQYSIHPVAQSIQQLRYISLNQNGGLTLPFLDPTLLAWLKTCQSIQKCGLKSRDLVSSQTLVTTLKTFN